jgi:hypothetical protein
MEQAIVLARRQTARHASRNMQSPRLTRTGKGQAIAARFFVTDKVQLAAGIAQDDFDQPRVDDPAEAVVGNVDLQVEAPAQYGPLWDASLR